METKSEEVEKSVEIKDDKTPETPVTEPLTNGTSSPDTPKAEDTPTIEETPSSNEKETEKPKTEVEHLPPMNGLSLEEKQDLPEVEVKVESHDSKSEETTAASSEPAPEISVKTEVCVEPIPVIESTPPPLPANPPPSSVASFAITTMASHIDENTLIDNTSHSEIQAQLAISPTNNEISHDNTAPVIEESKESPVIEHVNITSQVNDNCTNDNVNQIENKTNEDDHVPILTEPKKDINVEIETIEFQSQDITKIASDTDTEVNSPDSANVLTIDNVNENTNNTLNDLLTKTNGIDELTTNKDSEGNECDKDKLKIIENVHKTNDISLNNEENFECNGNIDVIESNETEAITETAQLLNNTSDSKMTTSPDDSAPPSLSETVESIPPPLQEEDLSQNGEDNHGDNEETSESFPPPPLPCCDSSESEQSAACLLAPPADSAQVNTNQPTILNFVVEFSPILL